MQIKRSVVAIVPAYNEADAIELVVRDLHALRDENDAPLLTRVIVADNGSDDGTGALATKAGAVVVREPRRGYGFACMAAVSAADDADVLLFVDGDHSVIATEAIALLNAIDKGADLVIGARTRSEPGAMTLPQRFGNALACAITRNVWGIPISDLGPFRAIRRTAFERLDMKNKTYGWTIEMQIRAMQLGQHVEEVPVSIRCRLGVSKISGTVKGVIGAGVGILSMIAKLWWQERSRVALHQRRTRGI